ncbi:ribonucleoside hydrolase RihC [Levilactobacillus namurensis DSM 19117]|uniref:Ribonucleoside hydrolase RihC n=1 Tax=Levilactobacillus namurensis DSM 19117 TaxID=1423773 RepID=A0A0R1JR58_9LACO|nr:ribonucleoside hydrolase RihC [Levilactobacillus namurensis]PTM21417.1 ribonucleoside hydrolase RihC [Lactobacillus sp. PFC-70]KRK73624.1 ribonucleoside hydrolase RihC [Levilactobacillus namurensis DSM 19117]MCW3779058.1 ribonucleoside hydrolase RihC [Levilactobacillus namurensis]MDT7019454.1 ribonucleoside hydrolase RihC [Levilactobacillus namurensis]WNN65953.1 ribonucleoside hydrolase RihC [Levilactobacillus namurensis]
MTIKILMDTDPGIDDAAALTMAINDPKIDLKLITTVAGNVTVDKTTKNALKIVRFFNQSIPVAAGAEQPLFKDFEDAARIHGESGMPGYDFPEDLPKPLNKTAVEALHDEIMASQDPITLVPTGSYTNIALLFSEYPEVKSHIDRIVAMGGALGKGNMTSAAEFNVFTDPDAAAIVYKSGIPIVMVGLDITMKALLTNENIEKLQHINEAGQMLHDIIINDGDHSDKGSAMHDVNTIFYLLHPEAIKTEDMWVDVVTQGPAIGETVGDIRGAYHNGKTNAKVSVDIDDQAFNDWFMQEVRNIKM